MHSWVYLQSDQLKWAAYSYFLPHAKCRTIMESSILPKEGCAKCFVVHIPIKIWNFANHMKKQNKKHQNAKFNDKKLKTKSLIFFV